MRHKNGKNGKLQIIVTSKIWGSCYKAEIMLLTSIMMMHCRRMKTMIKLWGSYLRVLNTLKRTTTKWSICSLSIRANWVKKCYQTRHFKIIDKESVPKLSRISKVKKKRRPVNTHQCLSTMRTRTFVLAKMNTSKIANSNAPVLCSIKLVRIKELWP